MTLALLLADTWDMHGDDIGTGWMIVMMLGMVLFWGLVILAVIWLVREYGHPARRIAGDFTTAVEKILAGYGAEEVKTIGDEVMIRVADPNTAVRLGLRIVDELAHHGSPPVRVGIHSGPAIRRDGDWFGSTVNLAARVTDAAKPGEALLTDQTRSELGDSDQFELEEGGARYFKHVPELIPVHRARIALSPGARAARKGFLINLAAFGIVGGAHLAVWAARGFTEASVGRLALFAAWAIALVIHYRTVRAVL